MVVEARVLQQVQQAARGSCFGVGATENDATQTGVHDGSGAHRTWLFGDVEVAFVQPPIAKGGKSLSHGQHFGMGGGIPQ